MLDPGASESPTVEEFVAAVRLSAAPVALWDLRSSRILAVSPEGATLLGLEPSAEDVDWLSLLEDPEPARRGLEALRSGLFDAYQAHRQLRVLDGELREIVAYVRIVDDTRGLAVAVFVDANRTVDEQFADIGAVVGTLDDAGRIRQISSDVTGLLGYLPAVCLGLALESLVHPADVGLLIKALSTTTSDDAHVAVDVRIRAADGSWQPVHLTLGALTGDATAFGFAAVPPEQVTLAAAAAADRVSELEQHLMRIAREVETAGLIGRQALIADPARMPALDELSSRQWQILSRILAGERVPTIARAMYVSPSTIRNHLSTIFRKLGVHSQAELIEKFQRPD